MNVLFFLLFPAIIFYLAYKFYSRNIAKTLDESDKNITPAVEKNDGRDYVPTKKYVVFAHHFSAIAGAGPIIGPTMAILYGFVPTWLWILLGGVFLGAVHDFTTLFISMREKGKSIAEVAHQTLGKTGFNLMISFTIIMLLLVCSSFLSATVISLTSLWPVAKLGITDAGNTILKTVEVDGVIYGRIGGIASMSVIVITLCAPLLGWLIFKKGIKSYLAYSLAAFICIISILLGIKFPIMVSPIFWMIAISIYVLFASGTPVWVILQPRDFINVQILYSGVILMLISIIVSGFSGIQLSMPSFNLQEGVNSLGLIWPMMFITIACGAISGFHSLVGGGTTCKQISKETDARKIGFNSMLLESLLAICVVIALSIGLTFVDYKAIVWPVEAGVKSNPILGFSLAAGNLFHLSLGIPVSLGTVFGILLVEGFVVTTLDSAVRLNRYLLEELWTMLFKNPAKILKNHWFNSLLTVIIMLIMSYSNAFSILWPIFGAANQLLAALALLTVSSWLVLKGKKYLFALIPAGFMLLTTIAALIILMLNYIKTQNYILIFVDILLLSLSVGVILLALKIFKRNK